MLEQAGCGRENQIRGGRTDNDELNIARADASCCKCSSGCTKGEIRRSLAFSRNMPLANTGATGDPLVVGIDELFQLYIGDNAFR